MEVDLIDLISKSDFLFTQKGGKTDFCFQSKTDFVLTPSE